MKSKEELLNENSLLNEKLFKGSPKSEDTTSKIISFFPEYSFKEGTKQKALSLFAFNKNFYESNQKQRLEDAFVRYVSKGNTKTVEEMLQKHSDFKIHQLLGYLASGNQHKAEEILKEHPELLLERGSVIDPSGRHFKNITPFELVLWTMDVRYMAGIILKCLPKNEKGEDIRKQLVLQYQTVIDDYDQEKGTGGVHYTLNGMKYHEQHFDFNPLINALDTYVTKYNDWSLDQCIKHWCGVVGKEQLWLPMHVRHHYCDPEESFFPTPEFNKKELKRTLKIYNYVTNQQQTWDSGLVGLGLNFGITRWDERWPAGDWHPPPCWAGCDLGAIRRLCEVRTKDYSLLKEELMKPLQKSNDIENFSNLNF